jgi:enoyl-CoA hydratase/carnithine racemase
LSGNEELLMETEDAVAVLTLNRPDKGNALTVSLLGSLAETLGELAQEGSVRCVVIKGAAEKFSVGMDLDAMMTMTPEEKRKLIGAGGPLRKAAAAIEAFPFQVVAMIRGHAAGAACELAVSCDLRVGCGATRMGMPPARLGIVYPPEGLERFVRTLGLTTTRKLFYTARYYKGPELYVMGMLDFLCEDGELEEFTMKLARELAGNAPLSMKGHKRALRLLAGSAPLSDQVKAEIDALGAEAMSSTGAIEGIVAFKEKRPPDFKGR